MNELPDRPIKQFIFDELAGITQPLPCCKYAQGSITSPAYLEITPQMELGHRGMDWMANHSRPAFL